MTLPRIVFAGTPAFAAHLLASLLEKPAFEIAAVFTQPARPRGRGLALEPSEVETLARAKGIRVETPERWTSDSTRLLAELSADVLLTAAYGLILPRETLAVPRRGCLNVHASLLPRWRGAAPIQRAIEAGDTETGITIFQIEEGGATEGRPSLARQDAAFARGVDSGPMLARRAVAIAPDETAVTLSGKLEVAAASLLPALLEEWLADRVAPEPQDHALATRARKVRKEEGRLDWSRPALEIDRKFRAFQPWPGVTVGGVKLVKAAADRGDAALGAATAGPGVILSMDPLRVATADGIVRLDVVQEPGRHAVPGAAWARGRRLAVGAMMP